MYNIIYWWARLFLRIYFRRTIVFGREDIPVKGPLIVASNHPSAFMEASVVATVMKRPLHFLVRGDVFHPKFRWLFDWTNQIPIYRQKDGISNLRKNASSFDLTYKKLAEGNAVLIFPEAKTALEKKLRPVQRGTAHLAFGTLPLLEKGEELHVLPVGINFMNPRIPGTDVIIRFGKPFVTAQATREDRDAIEEFTSHLSDAMSPLVIQITDSANEAKYDVLASIYLATSGTRRSDESLLSDLMKIAAMVNDSASHPELLHEVNQHIHLLNKEDMKEGIYFPQSFLMNKLLLSWILMLKTIWFLAGGWAWRLTRKLIFSKIKTDTFQGPTSLGAAMVLFPLLSLIGFLKCWIFGFPYWIVPVWWLLMMLGKWISSPLTLLWKILICKNATRKRLLATIKTMRTNVESEFTGQ